MSPAASWQWASPGLAKEAEGPLPILQRLGNLTAKECLGEFDILAANVAQNTVLRGWWVWHETNVGINAMLYWLLQRLHIAWNSVTRMFRSLN